MTNFIKEDLFSPKKNYVDVIKNALDSGISINAQDEHNWTPLHHAAWAKLTEAAAFIVKSGGDVNARDKLDRTPLHWAAVTDKIELLNILLDAGADVNARTKSGQTPLQEASHKIYLEIDTESDFMDIARRLIEVGADVNAKDNYGWTALHYAADNNRPELIKLLLECGANPYVTNDAEHLPWHYIDDSFIRNNSIYEKLRPIE